MSRSFPSCIRKLSKFWGRLYTVGPANHEIKVGYGFAHGLTVTIVHLVLGSLLCRQEQYGSYCTLVYNI